jgi:predicted transcriptional regulator
MVKSRRRSLTPFGETEMEVLHHVWDLGEATVADVHSRILAERSVAYTTVMTVMRKLADKGFLTFTRDGPSYVYSAARPPEEVRQDLLRDVVEKVFKGSPSALVQSLVEDEHVSETERNELVRLIEELDAQEGHDG